LEVKKIPVEEDGISNRQDSTTFVPPLTDGPGANPGFLTNENGPVRFAFASFLQLESNLLRTFHFSKTRKESHERRNYCLYRHMYCSRSTLDLAPHSVARSGEERGQHTFTRNAGRFCAA
jgi:hypothetical protein